MMNAWSHRVAAIRLLFRSAALIALSITLTPQRVNAEDVTLQWDRVASHTNLANYILKYGATSGSYTGSVNVATNVTTTTVNNLAAGRTYYFVAVAKNVSGMESDPSNEISYTVPGTVVNAAPVADDATTSTTEDTAKAITLTGSDSDDDSLTFSIVSAPANGSLTGTPPNVTYQPAANFNGSDSFTFRAYDGITNSATATVTVTVSARNDPPTLNTLANLTLATNAGLQTVTLAGIGSGAANESQTLTISATSSNPSLIPTPTVTYTSPNTTGSLSFTPANGASGSATITVTVNDNQSQNNTFARTFVVSVGSSSGGPLFFEAEDGVVTSPMSVANNANASGGQYVSSDTDAEGATTLSFTIAQAGDYYVWCRVLSIDSGTDSFYVGVDAGEEDTYSTSPNAWSPNWQWTLLSGFTAGTPRILTLNAGNHTIAFRCRESNTGLDAIYITSDPNFTPPTGGANRPPTLTSISNVTVAEDASQQTVNLAGITSGSASETQTLSVSATSSNEGLIPAPSITYTSPNATGTLRFTPTANSNGTATITVTVNDGQSVSNTFSRTFNVTVTTVNDAPTLNAINNVTVSEDSGNRTVNLSGISSGAANESQTLQITATSSDTSLIPAPTVTYTSPNATGTVTFRPVTNATGNATITVTVNDGQTTSNSFSRTFTVTVTGTNDAPTISNIANQSVNESTSTPAIAFTVADVETTAASLTLSGSSSNPTLVPNNSITFGGTGSGRTVTITPTPTLFGTAIITVTVTDAQGGTAADTFTLTVNPVNQAPTLDALSNVTIAEDSGQRTVNLSGITTGATNENDALTVTVTSSNPSLIPTPTVTYTSPNATGSIRFTPATNASGSATITVTVNDGQSQNATFSRAFAVTVTNVNDLPTISDIANQTVAEGNATAALAFTISDPETTAGNLTVSGTSSDTTLVPNASIILAGSGASRTVRVTPAATRFGSATITITVTDAQGGTASDSFVLTVSPVNQPPTLNTLANLTLNEDAALQTVNLAGISTGNAAESDTLAVSVTSSNPALIPTPAVNYTSPNATGTLTFTPAANASGSATITVNVNDGQASSNTITRSFTVTVNPVNDAPTLNTLADLNITEDSAAQVVSLSGITSGATNESQTLVVTATSSTPSVVPNPTVSYTSPNATGSLTLKSATNATGSAVITVTVSDGQSINSTITRTFAVNVSGINDPPTISAIQDQAVEENQATTALAFTIGDTETPAASLVVAATSSNPTLVSSNGITLGGAGASRHITITPVSGQSGITMISVTVSDANNGTATEIFMLNVNAVNQAPTLDPIDPVALNEDAPAQTVELAGISTGSFNELQTLSITAVSSNPALIPNPTVTYTSPNFTGSLRFTPVANASGSATITVTINDGASQNSTFSQSFTITVNPVNDAPNISNIADQSIDQDTATATLPFTIGDSESPVASLTIAGNSSNPALVPNANIVLGGSGSNRTVRVNPVAGEFGTAIITITVADGTGGVNSDSFNLTVSTVNFRPTIDDLVDVIVVEDGEPTTLNLTGITSGSSSENQPLTVTALSADTNLIAHPVVVYSSPDDSGTITFVPKTNAFGETTITLTVSDGQSRNGTVSKSFVVTINPANDEPTLQSIDNLILAQNASSEIIPLLGITSGAANESQPLVVIATSSNPGLIPDPVVTYFSPNTSGSLTVTPNVDAYGTATITVTVDDGEAENNLAVRTFTVTVVGTNSPPTITDFPDRTVPMNGVVASVPFVIQDLETAAENLRIAVSSSNPSLVWTNDIVISGTGSNRITSIMTTRGAHGYTVITYTVYDEDGASSSDSFVLAVVPPNTQPTLDSIASRFVPEDSGPHIIDLTGITAGGEDEDQTLIVSAYSSNPGVIPHPIIDYTSPNTSGTLTFAPASNVVGSATIIVTVNDGQSRDYLVTRTFGVIVTEENDAPEISSIPNQVVEQNTPTSEIPFIVSDREVPADSLQIAASSSDQTLVPDANIDISGTSENRTVTVTPANLRSGVATITIFVSDATSSSSTSFQITVGNGNTPPAVATPTIVAADSYSEVEVPLTVTDRESRPEDLLITAASSNPNVVPDSNISISGSGSNRVMHCRPVAGRSGTVNINLGVSDGRAVTRRNVQLSVSVGTPPSEPLSIRRNGRGTVKPMLDGQLLTIGKTYTITAIPADDEVFVRWSHGATSALPKLTFVMVSNLVLEVTFTNNPYTDRKGNYSGLFYETTEVNVQSSGSFIVTPTERGTYTGKLKLGATTYSMSGSLDLLQKGTNVIQRKGTNAINVELDFGSIEDQVVGRVTDGNWEAPLSGDRAVFNSKTAPCPFLGSYTLVIPGQDAAIDGPQGDSFGTVKVDGNGLATLAGTLADGTKFAAKTPIASSGQWPVHIPLYGSGELISWMNYTNRPTDDITGLLNWIKPVQTKAKYHADGFTNETMVIGSTFMRPTNSLQPVLELSDPVIYFAGGNLTTAFTNSISWGEKNKVTNLGANKLTLTVTTSSGLFSGTVTDPATGKSTKFSGAVLQKLNVGSGFMLGTNSSSLVSMGDFTE